MNKFLVIKLTEKGLHRVLNGEVGMTFIVDCFTEALSEKGQVAHVRDYRDPENREYVIWSIGPDGYEIV